MSLIYNSEKFDSSLNFYREIFSNTNNIPTTDGNEQQYESSILIPLDFSLEMDGISGIIPNSAFEVPSNVLPTTYLTKKKESKIAFILHTVDHNFNNNKWTTKITGQTILIRFDPLSAEEIERRKKAKEIIKKKRKSGGDSNNSGKAFNIPNPISPSQEFWTLVAICAKEDRDDQGRADIAQSIYNRLGSLAYAGENITTLVTKRYQYEPTWRYPKGPQEGLGNANKEWFEITDIQSAVRATGLPTNELQLAAKAIKNKQLQAKAKKFIGGRTDFLGVGQPAKAMTNNGSKKQRSSLNNQFGFSYLYKENVIYPIPKIIENFFIT